MDHLTDKDITQFFMGGPADEAAFTRTIAHLHQCKVCRERSWQWLTGMREQAHKILGSLTKSLMAGLGGDEPSDDSDEVAEALARSVKSAIAKLADAPEQKDWDSEDLFGSPQFDDAHHLASCKKCRRIFETMAKITQKVIEKGMEAKDARLTAAAVRLKTWFDINRTRIQEAADMGGGLGGGGSERAFCG